MSETIKVSREIPVVADVDVVVAGGGIAGATAAVAAAREGARTILVDRFGYLGGNMGPGMFSGGVVHLALEHPYVQYERLKGIPGEFLDRCEGHADHLLGRDYLKDHQIVAYVWFKMMEECNVHVMLNTFACDPIMDGNTATGLIIENKSGRQAIRAKVVIDATGDSSVSFRTGAPLYTSEMYVHPGMYFAVGGVDTEKYLAWRAQAQVSDEDVKWADDIATRLGSWGVGRLKPFFPLMRRAWGSGEYRFVKPIGDLGVVTVDHGIYAPQHNMVGGQVGVADSVLTPNTKRQIACGDNAVMTALETGCRIYIFETAQFLHRHVPGCENACLQMISPYFHARGGRGVMSEYVLTKEDAAGGVKFDDVVFVTYDDDAAPGYDFPYRQLIPKGVGGMLAAGRSAIMPPPSNRARWKCLTMGQIAGVAAAQAVRQNVTPGKINVKQLQRALHRKYHADLGEPERVKELGLLA